MISVIVPVYNTGDILRNTIESIIAQSYRNFELLLIDDGSTDKSGEICDAYMRLDSRIRVFHEINGGVSRARNIGIKNAKGEYITFCDHDDTYEPDLLKIEMETILSFNADIVIVGAKHHYEDTNKTNIYSRNMYFSGKDEIRNNFYEIFNSGMLDTIWNILYKKNVIKGLLFEEKYKRGHEDANFNMDVVERIHTLKSVDKVLYNHVIRSSMSTSAQAHRESLPAIKALNDKIFRYLEVKPSFIERNLTSYMKFQGGFMRAYSLFCVLTGMNKHEFAKNVASLKYHATKKNNKLIMDKDYMVFLLINTRNYYFLFFILRLFVTLFKRKKVL